MTGDPSAAGSRPRGADFSTSRLEAFSDGVFAIAITLLVLNLDVPAPDTLHGQSLAEALGRQWPAYFAYLVSFLVIGVLLPGSACACPTLAVTGRDGHDVARARDCQDLWADADRPNHAICLR